MDVISKFIKKNKLMESEYKMKITVAIIEGLKPCEPRFNNFKANYKNFDGDIKEFLALDKITYDDKIWVWVRLASKPQLIKWAGLCAQSVLYIFESKYPNDQRPRKTIEAALKVNKSVDVAAAHAAAYDAHAARFYAAYAAADAVRAVANATANAVAYTATNAAAYAATAAARAAARVDSRQNQQQKNLNFILEVL